jgi:hypothetical protein
MEPKINLIGIGAILVVGAASSRDYAMIAIAQLFESCWVRIYRV